MGRVFDSKLGLIDLLHGWYMAYIRSLIELKTRLMFVQDSLLLKLKPVFVRCIQYFHCWSDIQKSKGWLYVQHDIRLNVIQNNYTQHNDKNDKLSINDAKHNNTPHLLPLSWVSLAQSVVLFYCYAECHHAECLGTLLRHAWSNAIPCVSISSKQASLSRNSCKLRSQMFYKICLKKLYWRFCFIDEN